MLLCAEVRGISTNNDNMECFKCWRQTGSHVTIVPFFSLIIKYLSCAIPAGTRRLNNV